MALLSTAGTFFQPFNHTSRDYTPKQSVFMQGKTSGAGAAADVTLSAFGGLSGSSYFHLTDVYVSLYNYTVTCRYNLLYAGTTICNIAPEAGGNITANSTVIFKELHFGAGNGGVGLVAETTSTTQLLALVMSCATATGTAAVITAQGYFG